MTSAREKFTGAELKAKFTVAVSAPSVNRLLLIEAVTVGVTLYRICSVSAASDPW